MCTGSASMVRLRGVLMATLLSFPVPALATFELHLIAEHYSQNPTIGISRDNHLILPVETSSSSHQLYLYGNDIGLVNTGLASSVRVTQAQITLWGYAFVGDTNGSVPINIYAGQIGQSPQIIQPFDGFSVLGSLGINDAGTVTFTGFKSGHLDVLRWTPGGSPQTLPDVGASGSQFSFVDGSGALYYWMRYQSAPLGRIEKYTDATGWTNLTAGFADTVQTSPPGLAWAVNPSGLIAFPGTYDGGAKAAIYLASGSSFLRIFDRPLDGTTPVDTQVSISDRGDVLALMGNESNLAFLRKMLLYTHDGRTIDLETLLPAGKSGGLFKTAAMNYRGDVVIEATDIATNTFEYYAYDGQNLSLLLDGQPFRAISLHYGNNGLIYFNRTDNKSMYSLYQTVPEPAAMLLFGTISLVMCLRRRTNR